MSRTIIIIPENLKGLKKLINKTEEKLTNMRDSRLLFHILNAAVSIDLFENISGDNLTVPEINKKYGSRK